MARPVFWGMYRHVLIVASSLGICAMASGGQMRPTVVELYTSEGCSSCPPAESYIGELTRRANVLPLTFHVDYWDNLGWRDRFGLPQSVQRQRAYAKELHLSTIYTPQVVLDGRGNFVGSDRDSIDRALGEDGVGTGVGVAVTFSTGELLIDVDADLDAKNKAAASDVVLVAYQHSAISPIARGENSGRTLQEYNIVRDFRPLGRWEGERRQFRAPLNSLPKDATDVAVLVQSIGPGNIIGAVSRPLR
jgi:hypothetical protein